MNPDDSQRLMEINREQAKRIQHAIWLLEDFQVRCSDDPFVVVCCRNALRALDGGK